MTDRPNKTRRRVPTDLGSSPSLAKQSFKDECDINNIVGQFRTKGLLTHVAQGQPKYLDVSAVPDFRAALTHVNNVRSYFMGLPADLRSEFGNDPAAFMDGLNDPETREYLATYGIDPEPIQDAPTPSEAPQEASGGEGADNEPTG